MYVCVWPHSDLLRVMHIPVGAHLALMVRLSSSTTSHASPSAAVPNHRLPPSVLDALSAHLERPFHRAFVRLREDVVDLLERQVRRLGVAEVHQGHERKVRTHEDQVAFPRQSIQQDWRDHDNEEVPEPIAGDSDGGTFCTSVQREDFRDIDPGDAVY